METLRTSTNLSMNTITSQRLQGRKTTANKLGD
jgi:hypothetical protein